jgi:hypothetical protein
VDTPGNTVITDERFYRFDVIKAVGVIRVLPIAPEYKEDRGFPVLYI